MTRLTFLVALVLLLAACGDDDTGSADTGADAPDANVDAAGDSGRDDAADAAPDVNEDSSPPDTGTVDSGEPDTGPPGRICGDEHPDVSGITGTEGVIIARDGTLYYSQSGGVGRRTPAGAQEDDFIRFPGASTIWGLALSPDNATLYVGSPGDGRIYIVTLADSSVDFIRAPGANGLTAAPDGTLFWSNFSDGEVFRLGDGEAPEQVTTTSIRSANGVAFGADGALYVAHYRGGMVLRLTLTDGVETGRTTYAESLGNPDGLVFDEAGDLYVSDNGSGTVLRVAPDGTQEMIASGLPAAASVEFGAGPLSCTDLFIASAGGLGRVDTEREGRLVPWH